MSSTLQRFQQNIHMMVSEDNPNRLCGADSQCRRTFFITGIILCVVVFYFGSLGLGYGMTYVAMKNTYNMTNGCKIDDDNCIDKIRCHYDGSAYFYAGCLCVGIICDLILAATFFIIIVFVLVFRMYIILCYSEVEKSFDSAQKMTNNYEIDKKTCSEVPGQTTEFTVRTNSELPIQTNLEKSDNTFELVELDVYT